MWAALKELFPAPKKVLIDPKQDLKQVAQQKELIRIKYCPAQVAWFIWGPAGV